MSGIVRIASKNMLDEQLVDQMIDSINLHETILFQKFGAFVDIVESFEMSSSHSTSEVLYLSYLYHILCKVKKD